MPKFICSQNRKATFEYEILDKYTAGLVLWGYEVKSVREGNVNFEGSLVTVLGGEACVVNLHIGRYSHQSQKYNEAAKLKPRHPGLDFGEKQSKFSGHLLKYP